MTAAEVIACCRTLATFSEEAGVTTRTFLSAPMRQVHRLLQDEMEQAGMRVSVDAVGNLRGLYPAQRDDAARLIIGSHLDTVRQAGAFDGVLGVVLGIALVQRLAGRRLPIALEVIGFSEEEGVRFGVPFIGSRAVADALDGSVLATADANGVTIGDTIRAYGLDPDLVPLARAGGNVLGYLEFHIEQGPVLAERQLPLGVVSAIVGQSRYAVTFVGSANHAGTTPMLARQDALAGAAEWIGAVERRALATPGLVATVGRVDVIPGAANVIAGACIATLDVRHADDELRTQAAADLLDTARAIAQRRGLQVRVETRLLQAAVPTDAALRRHLETAVAACGYPLWVMPSGAGHDAMVMAGRMPIAMLFLRTPGGISHHPDEHVLEPDVEAGLRVGLFCLETLAEAHHD